MAQIFISYARKDKDEVYPIVEELKDNGLDCWIDLNGIETGSQFKDIIISAIDSCSVFLYMLSENTLKSEWCQKEYNYANGDKKIYPVLLRGAKGNKKLLFDFSTMDCIDIYDTNQKEKLIRDLKKSQGSSTAIKEEIQSKGSVYQGSITTSRKTEDTIMDIIKSLSPYKEYITPLWRLKYAALDYRKLLGALCNKYDRDFSNAVYESTLNSESFTVSNLINTIYYQLTWKEIKYADIYKKDFSINHDVDNPQYCFKKAMDFEYGQNGNNKDRALATHWYYIAAAVGNKNAWANYQRLKTAI